MIQPDITSLSNAQLEELRAEAQRNASPFVDPSAMHTLAREHFYPEWAEAILGHPYRGVNYLTPWEMGLLVAALQADPIRPVPSGEVARQEERRKLLEIQIRKGTEEFLAVKRAWHELRDRLPINVSVGHNFTIGHYDGHVAGKDHIVTQEEFTIGRLHRPSKYTLCETPSKRASGTRNKDPLRGVDRDDDGEDRIPTCKLCLSVAERLAE